MDTLVFMHSIELSVSREKGQTAIVLPLLDGI